MGKGPGKQSSNKIINQDEKEVALGKKNGRAACPKDMLKLFRALLMYVGCSCTKVYREPVLYLLFQIYNVHCLNDLSYKPFLS